MSFLTISLVAVMLILPNNPTVSAEDNTVTTVSEIVCRRLTMSITSVFTLQGPGHFKYFRNQEATVNSGEKRSPFVLDSQRTSTPYDYGEQDFGVLYAYRCETGYGKKKYLRLLLSVGGSCDRCEWVDIVDENGKRIASSRGSKRGYNAYSSICKRVGISARTYFGDWTWIDFKDK